MKPLTSVSALALTIAVGVACSETTAPQTTDIVVMTRNMYLGAALEPIMVAPATQVPVAAATAWATVVATDFRARAGRLAAEIADAAPHVIGLQEVPLFRRQSPSDLVLGGFTPAITVAYDFLQLVLDSLAVRGQTYLIARAVIASDIEIPVLTGVVGGVPQFDDVRYTDRDAILVRAGVDYQPAGGGVYTARIPLSVGGVPVEVRRGWTTVRLSEGGTSFLFVNTHLEDQVEAVQVAQAEELLAGVADEVNPIVLVGDLNSAATGDDTPTYGMLTGAGGFTDVWSALRPGESGFTCCQAENLANPSSALHERLDLVLVRNRPSGVAMGGTQIRVVGDDPANRTAGGLWPSDHAGLVATLHSTR